MANSWTHIIRAWHRALWPIVMTLFGLTLAIYETMVRGEARPAILAVALGLCARGDVSETFRRLVATDATTDD